MNDSALPAGAYQCGGLEFNLTPELSFLSPRASRRLEVTPALHVSGLSDSDLKGQQLRLCSASASSNLCGRLRQFKDETNVSGLPAFQASQRIHSLPQRMRDFVDLQFVPTSSVHAPIGR